MQCLPTKSLNFLLGERVKKKNWEDRKFPYCFRRSHRRTIKVTRSLNFRCTTKWFVPLKFRLRSPADTYLATMFMFFRWLCTFHQRGKLNRADVDVKIVSQITAIFIKAMMLKGKLCICWEQFSFPQKTKAHHKGNCLWRLVSMFLESSDTVNEPTTECCEAFEWKTKWKFFSRQLFS